MDTLNPPQKRSEIEPRPTEKPDKEQQPGAWDKLFDLYEKSQKDPSMRKLNIKAELDLTARAGQDIEEYILREMLLWKDKPINISLLASSISRVRQFALIEKAYGEILDQGLKDGTIRKQDTDKFHGSMMVQFLTHMHLTEGKAEFEGKLEEQMGREKALAGKKSKRELALERWETEYKSWKSGKEVWVVRKKSEIRAGKQRALDERKLQEYQTIDALTGQIQGIKGTDRETPRDKAMQEIVRLKEEAAIELRKLQEALKKKGQKELAGEWLGIKRGEIDKKYDTAPVQAELDRVNQQIGEIKSQMGQIEQSAGFQAERKITRLTVVRDVELGAVAKTAQTGRRAEIQKQLESLELTGIEAWTKGEARRKNPSLSIFDNKEQIRTIAEGLKKEYKEEIARLKAQHQAIGSEAGDEGKVAEIKSRYQDQIDGQKEIKAGDKEYSNNKDKYQKLKDELNGLDHPDDEETARRRKQCADDARLLETQRAGAVFIITDKIIKSGDDHWLELAGITRDEFTRRSSPIINDADLVKIKTALARETAKFPPQGRKQISEEQLQTLKAQLDAEIQPLTSVINRMKQEGLLRLISDYHKGQIDQRYNSQIKTQEDIVKENPEETEVEKLTKEIEDHRRILAGLKVDEDKVNQEAEAAWNSEDSSWHTKRIDIDRIPDDEIDTAKSELARGWEELWRFNPGEDIYDPVVYEIKVSSDLINFSDVDWQKYQVGMEGSLETLSVTEVSTDIPDISKMKVEDITRMAAEEMSGIMNEIFTYGPLKNIYDQICKEATQREIYLTDNQMAVILARTAVLSPRITRRLERLQKISAEGAQKFAQTSAQSKEEFDIQLNDHFKRNTVRITNNWANATPNQ